MSGIVRRLDRVAFGLAFLLAITASVRWADQALASSSECQLPVQVTQVYHAPDAEHPEGWTETIYRRTPVSSVWDPLTGNWIVTNKGCPSVQCDGEPSTTCSIRVTGLGPYEASCSCGGAEGPACETTFTYNEPEDGFVNYWHGVANCGEVDCEGTCELTYNGDDGGPAIPEGGLLWQGVQCNCE